MSRHKKTFEEKHLQKIAVTGFQTFNEDAVGQRAMCRVNANADNVAYPHFEQTPSRIFDLNSFRAITVRAINP